MKYKLIGIYLLLQVIISCNKYLDKKNDSSLLVPVSLTDAQALLDSYDQMNSLVTPSFGEVSADDYFLKKEIYNGLTLQDQHNYTWRYYFSGPNNDWLYGYKPVYVSNLCLDLLKHIERNQRNAINWDQVKGSALFYRSYNFLNLLWNYANAYDSSTADKDLGIALRLTSDFNSPSIRATNKKSYEQVITDTKSALSLLPDYPQIVTRPSKGAAYGLLARCYLSMRDYQNALKYADSALQLNNHLMDLNGDEDIPLGINAAYPFKRFNKETIFYTEMDGVPSLFYSPSKSRMDTSLYYSFNVNDLRKTTYFKQNADGYFQFKGAYSNSLACFSGIAVDEMYLVRAECNIRLNYVENGLDDLNTLLNNRFKSNTYIPFNLLSKQDALAIVLFERRKELTMRGLRWMDLKRLNKEGANIILTRIEDDATYILEPNANYYALPLPDGIIQQTGMIQNPL